MMITCTNFKWVSMFKRTFSICQNYINTGTFPFETSIRLNQIYKSVSFRKIFQNIKNRKNLEKKSIMFVKKSRKQLDSKGSLYVDITSHFSFLRGTLHVNFQPGVKFIPGWIQLYLWSKLSSWLHAEMSWNFSPTVISTLS